MKGTNMQPDHSKLDRRFFLKTTAAGIGSAAIGAGLLHAEDKSDSATQPAVKVNEKDLIRRSEAPSMEYRRLGRTNYMVSRIVHGFSGEESHWRRILAGGINYFDTARGYGKYEVDLAPFLKKYRDKLWITSKATGVAGSDKVDEEVATLFGEGW